MQIVSCVGFHATGAGAVDDFLKEFDNCASAATDVECRFLQDPDGISDLEYNLVENPHRLNSGFALHRYLDYAKRTEHTYRLIFGDKWLPLSESYIRSLVSVEYNGYWHGDLWRLSKSEKLYYYFRRGINLITPGKWKKPNHYNYFPQKKYWHVEISEDQFIERTKAYCNSLVDCLNSGSAEYIILDQATPCSNISRYMRYIEGIKIILVDRDPRDLYINETKNGAHVLPCEEDVFVQTYRDHRKHIGELNSSKVLRIHFEDLIYNYDITTARIMDFLGLKESNHVDAHKIFRPEISINNTRLWEKLPQYKTAAEYIGNELPEFLYAGFAK